MSSIKQQEQQQQPQSRKSSMTMGDLEAIREQDMSGMLKPAKTPQEAKYMEHSEIFEDLCNEAETDDMQSGNSNKQRGAGSGSHDDMELVLGSSTVSTSTSEEFRTLHKRRHSSYESSMRSTHREHHQEIKEHLHTMEDEHSLRRASFVNHLLEFNLSVDVSMADLNADPEAEYTSPAMHLSCPVLSYMNDDEEDSVELRIMHRPSLISVEEEAPWESLKDCGSQMPREEEKAKEYVLELPPLPVEDPNRKMRPKRRRPHSYKILEEKLATQSPLNVLKSWNTLPAPAAMAPITIQPKSLEVQNGMDDFQRARDGPVATRAQVARGA